MHIVSAFVLVTVMTLASNALAQKKEVRVAAFTHAKSATVVHVLVPFIEAVNKEVGGEVQAKGYWGGSLGRNPKKYYDLIKDGVIDVGSFDPGYSPGRFGDFGLFELPFTAQSGTEASIAMWRLYKQGLLGGLDGIKVLGFYSTDIFSLHTTKPAESVFELGGMKVRAAGRIHGETIRAMGGVPIGIPITQTTESLSRGLVDGVMLGFTGINIFRMLPIVKYHYEVPLGGFPLVIAMNEKAWNGLSPTAKAAYEKHGGLEMARNGGGGFDKLREMFLGKMKKAGGHTIVGLRDADFRKRRAAVQPIYDSWIRSVPNGQKKFNAYLKVLADIRAGR